MHVIFVLGTWSSGSTAITGYLERLGAYTCPPHIQTRDDRTPNSHESVGFRNLLARYRDELTLRELRPADALPVELGAWLADRRKEAAAAGARVIALKHPLSAFFVPALVRAAGDCSFLVVTRRFAEIEKTRQRRRWHQVYGAAGAGPVYSALMSGLIEAQRSFEAVAFREFLDRPEIRARLRAALPPPLNTADPAAAEAWLRR